LKETDFQETRFGKIPKDWQTSTLVKLVGNNDNVVAGPFGSNLKVEDYRDNGVPILRLQNIENCRFVNKDIKYVSEKKAEDLKYHSFLKGDIVLAKLGQPIGKTCLIPGFLENGIVVADVVRIRINNENQLDKMYAMYALNSPYVSSQLSRETIGTTRPRVNLSHVRNLIIAFPRLPEQRGIASILGVVDSAIGLADKVIAKTQRLKKGLMQQLLTRGIGHTEYKDTPIGKIPESWQAADFNTVCQDIIGGVAIETKDFTDSGFPVVSKGDIKDFGQLVFDKKEKKYVSEEFAEMYPNQIVHQGELVLAMRDLSTEMNFLGLAARVIDNHDYLAAQGVGILRINEEIVEPDFITNLTNSKRYREFIKRRGVGSTQVHLRTNELLSFKFGLPPLSEQRQIVSILSIADQKLKLEKQEKAKLEQLKLGLMDLLLTGKIRVKVN
jgi:type I restriction enzyme, S subunit